MAITKAKRDSLKASQFGLPSREAYPVDTVKRARNAKARASQQVGKSITPAQKNQIDRKANPVIKAAGGNPAPVGKRAMTARTSSSASAMPKPKRNPLHIGNARKVNQFFND